MPVTISYDLQTNNNNDRNYMRSMLERFHWRRLGGSVFRYEGVQDAAGDLYEDWLNHVAPALMFMRSYALQHGITFKFFTLDAQSVAFVDHSDPSLPFGLQPQTGAQIAFAAPTNQQSSHQTIRDFIDEAAAATA
jgi:hypothetical protein